jgi:hypothetical protein
MYSISLGLLTLSFTSCSQPLEPLDLAKKIFRPKPFPDLYRYTSGEYKGNPNGQDLQRGSITRFQLLQQSSDTAVVCMTVLDSSGKGLDTYLHFHKDSVWKMHAFRALAMTSIVEEAKNELEKMTLEEVDKIIQKSKTHKDEKSIRFSSRDDYYFALGNAKLTLSLDDSIVSHFLTHKAEFERLKKEALKELQTINLDEERATLLLKELEGDYKKLFISSISVGDWELGTKSLKFLIGGMIDNTVGYLYVEDVHMLPQINASRVIMLREIGAGWYLYKTT